MSWQIPAVSVSNLYGLRRMGKFSLVLRDELFTAVAAGEKHRGLAICFQDLLSEVQPAYPRHYDVGEYEHDFIFLHSLKCFDPVRSFYHITAQFAQESCVAK